MVFGNVLFIFNWQRFSQNYLRVPIKSHFGSFFYKNSQCKGYSFESKHSIVYTNMFSEFTTQKVIFQLKKNFLTGCVAFTYHKWYMQCSLLSALTSSTSDPYFMSSDSNNCGGAVGILTLLLMLMIIIKHYFNPFINWVVTSCREKLQVLDLVWHTKYFHFLQYYN